MGSRDRQGERNLGSPGYFLPAVSWAGSDTDGELMRSDASIQVGL